MEKKRNVFLETLKITVFLFMSTIGVLTFFGLVLGALQTKSQQLMYQAFGWTGILLTGFIGTPIHEMSHFIMCKIFGFTVHEVALFRPIAGKADGVLGYVSYSRNPTNILQTFGTFFVGIAPMLIGTLILLILFRLLLPDAFKAIKTDVADSLKDENIKPTAIFKLLWSTIKNLGISLVKARGWGIVRYIVFIVLMFAISSHLTLSPADLAGALPGLLVILALFIIVSFIIALSKQDVAIDLVRTALTISAFFSISVLFSVIGLGISYVLFLIFG